ncbi:MAG: AmmeMemoRadiSam system protein B [Desulfosoma sp.]
MEYPRLRFGLEAVPVQHAGRSYILLRDRLGYNEKPLLLHPEFAPFLVLMDGRHSIRDIQAYFLRRTGQLLYSEQIEEVVRLLDENLFLDNERFADCVQRETQKFREDPVRHMRHEGKSYPKEPEELRAFLDAMLRAGLPLVEGTSREELMGLVAPHIDLKAGSTTFGCAFAALTRMEPPDVWIVLGTGHEPIENAFAVTLKDFETPLGLVACDRDLASEIVRRAPRDVLAGEYAHSREHTIEFQAVFLAHVQPEALLVPVLCSFGVEKWDSQKPEIDKFCEVLRQVSEESRKSVGFLASVDLAHIGPRYGDDFRPNRLTVQEHMEADRKLLETLVNPHSEAFMEEILRDGNGRKVCGVPPLYVLSRVLQGKAQGRILHHDHAVVDSQGSFVTFAAMAFVPLKSPAS